MSSTPPVLAPTVPSQLDAVRVRIARIVALCVDLVQIVAVPLFAGGATSPANDVLDVLTMAVMVRLLGWHPAFLPSFIAELIPLVGLIPTWTAAVFIVTRKSR